MNVIVIFLKRLQAYEAAKRRINRVEYYEELAATETTTKEEEEQQEESALAMLRERQEEQAPPYINVGKVTTVGIDRKLTNRLLTLKFVCIELPLC